VLCAVLGARDTCFVDHSINADIFCIELHADPAEPNRIAGPGPRYLSLSAFSEFIEVCLRDYGALLG
jgi:hypothetical protein